MSELSEENHTTQSATRHLERKKSEVFLSATWILKLLSLVSESTAS